ncbi:PmoA family protein [Streptomyces pimonensis]|uniref:PmoA family protein n=1 Tax=Streptomyces pimonensis TaxID=2860288 RepID=A0ABV4J1Y9_9ACTN
MPDTPFILRHDDNGTEAVVSVGGTDVAHYVYRPDTPVEESPKPYLYPLRTLSGAPLGVYRPWDHRWHKGLQMTWSHLSGDNFWGGPTFEEGAPGHGYVWRENHGTQLHRAFDQDTTTEDADLTLREHLDWVASSDDRWLTEVRTLRFHSADPARGIWALDFGSDLTNVHDDALRMGSPTTHGRPNAGYTGLFWRGPRAWTDGDVIGADGHEGEDLMGARVPWAAIASDHDEIDGGATVLALAGTTSADVPLTWFARSKQFAALNPSPAFDTEIKLPPGDTLRLRHRFVFVDRRIGREELEPLAAEFAL